MELFTMPPKRFLLFSFLYNDFHSDINSYIHTCANLISVSWGFLFSCWNSGNLKNFLLLLFTCWSFPLDCLLMRGDNSMMNISIFSIHAVPLPGPAPNGKHFNWSCSVSKAFQEKRINAFAFPSPLIFVLILKGSKWLSNTNHHRCHTYMLVIIFPV